LPGPVPISISTNLMASANEAMHRRYGLSSRAESDQQSRWRVRMNKSHRTSSPGRRIGRSVMRARKIRNRRAWFRFQRKQSLLRAATGRVSAAVAGRVAEFAKSVREFSAAGDTKRLSTEQRDFLSRVGIERFAKSIQSERRRPGGARAELLRPAAPGAGGSRRRIQAVDR